MQQQKVHFAAAVASSNALSCSQMLTYLAHLWNILEQEDWIPKTVVWADLQFWLSRLGDKSLFQGGRPVHAFRTKYFSRCMYSCGCVSYKDRHGNTCVRKIRSHKTTVRAEAWPLATLFNQTSSVDEVRSQCETYHTVLRAVPIERILGNDPKNIGLQDNGLLENTDIVKQLSTSSPRIDPTLSLLLGAKQLAIEQELCEFSFANFHMVLIGMAGSIFATWHKSGWLTTNSSRANQSGIARDQICQVIMDLSCAIVREEEGSLSPEEIQNLKRKMTELAEHFIGLTHRHGRVGIDGIGTVTTQNTSTLKCLDEPLLKMLREAVEDSGAVSDFVRPEQVASIDGFEKVLDVEQKLKELFSRDK